MLRWESSIAAKRRGEAATRGTASSPALNFGVPENYDFIHCYHTVRLDPDPKLTESNQNSEFWIGSGSDPTKNMVWIRGGAEKYPTGRFESDLIKFGPAVEML
jgi:hypothetical protein